MFDPTEMDVAGTVVLEKFNLDIEEAPEICITLGTGLGAFADSVSIAKVRYDEVGFPMSGVEGHAGYLHLAEVGGKRIFILQGRIHLYEGWRVEDTVFATRVMTHLGVKTQIFTNAAGAATRQYQKGDLVLIEDHINATGVNPLTGIAPEGYQPFVGMEGAYTPSLRKLAMSAAIAANVNLRPGGVYHAISGGPFETPAEVNLYADKRGTLLGMSTVNSVIAARHMNKNVKILGISCVTNMGAGLGAQVNHNDNAAVANASGPQLAKLLTEIISRL